MEASLARLEGGELEYRCASTVLFRYVTAPTEPQVESPKVHFPPCGRSPATSSPSTAPGTTPGTTAWP